MKAVRKVDLHTPYQYQYQFSWLLTQSKSGEGRKPKAGAQHLLLTGPKSEGRVNRADWKFATGYPVKNATIQCKTTTQRRGVATNESWKVLRYFTIFQVLGPFQKVGIVVVGGLTGDATMSIMQTKPKGLFRTENNWNPVRYLSMRAFSQELYRIIHHLLSL